MVHLAFRFYTFALTNDRFCEDFAIGGAVSQKEEQEDIAASVGLLEEMGPRLPYPYSSGIQSSRHSIMRELRVQHKGRPYRVLYAFDPRRVAMLLIGGDKTGDDAWYDRCVPVADRIYDEHLIAIEKEGSKDD